MNSEKYPVETKYPESKHHAAYWKSRSVHERLDELENLREQYIRTLQPEQQKFQRVITVINRKTCVVTVQDDLSLS